MKKHKDRQIDRGSDDCEMDETVDKVPTTDGEREGMRWRGKKKIPKF